MKINKSEIWKALIHVKNQGEVPFYKHSAQLLLNTLAIKVQRKELNLRRIFFSSSGNTILSTFLRYKEIDVLLQTFSGGN